MHHMPWLAVEVAEAKCACMFLVKLVPSGATAAAHMAALAPPCSRGKCSCAYLELVWLVIDKQLHIKLEVVCQVGSVEICTGHLHLGCTVAREIFPCMIEHNTRLFLPGLKPVR